MPTAAEVTAAVTAELTAQPTSEVTEEVTPSSAARSGQKDGSAEPTEPLDFGIFLDPVNTGAAQRYEAPSAPAPEAMEAPRDPALAEARQPHPIDHIYDALTRSLAPPTAATREPDAEPPVEAEPGLPATGESSTDESAPAAASAPPLHEQAAGPVDEEQDPLLRMTLMHWAETDTDAADQLPAAAQGTDMRPAQHGAIGEATDEATEHAIDDAADAHDNGATERLDPLGITPFSLDADDSVMSDAEEPEFVRRGRRRQRAGRVLRVVMAVASVALLCGVLLQGVANFRQRIAGLMPALQPVLDQVCTTIDCRTRLAAEIDQLSIDANTELQTLTAGSDDYALILLLRNRSSSNQAWPHIELTLNDADDTAVARRVFSPREYLPAGQSLVTGFASQSEQPVRIVFALSQLKALGYRVAVFYP